MSAPPWLVESIMRRSRLSHGSTTAMLALALSGVVASCGAPLPSVPTRSPYAARTSTPLTTPSGSPSPSPSSAATPSPTPSPSPPPLIVVTPGWEAATVTFKTVPNARARLARLVAKGFRHYHIERDKQRFEVEREFPTSRLAAAEVRRLARAGLHAKVESSSSPK